MKLDDLRRGALIGLAVGDALGAAVEFQPPGSFKPVTDFRAGGPHPIPPGAWTDDTSMALALADSLATVGWDLNDQAARYVRWWRDGAYSVVDRCFDIGNATSAALARFGKFGDARTSGSQSRDVAGNGSIMRLAPVPMFYGDLLTSDPLGLADLAAESSLPTHAAPQCVSACRYMALILAGLMQGIPRATVLAPDWEPIVQAGKAKPWDATIGPIVAGSFREKRPPEIRGSGYVVRSLEAALWAFHDADSFEQAVLRAINLGEDADTTGAVCGQFAGAYWGASAIPQRWRDGLVRSETVEHYADALIHVKSISGAAQC